MWAVLSADRFRRRALDGAAVEEFWRSGDRHVAGVMAALEAHLGVLPRPDVSVDYGCGVGRLLPGLARHSRRVVGLDVSPTMLALAADRLAELQVGNVSLQQVDETLAAAPPIIDLLHSVLVLQHIAPSRGLLVLERLLQRVAPGGCAYLQFHVRGRGGHLMRQARRARNAAPALNRLAAMVVQHRLRPDLVPVYEYDLVRVLQIFARCDFPHLVVDPTGTSDLLDVTIYGQRRVEARSSRACGGSS